MSFWTKVEFFTQEGYFLSKTEQSVQGLQAFAFCVLQAFAFCVLNVNATVVFEHFEDLENLIILNILK